MNTSYALVFQQLQKDFFHTGTFIPSSKVLASAMVAHMTPKATPVTILEAGAGTGEFTREIARLLAAKDRLDIVEINGVFVDYLHQRLQLDPLFVMNEASIELVNADIQHFPLDSVYDYIVTGLPFSNFPPWMVESILATIMERLKPGGIFSYFQYGFIDKVRALINIPGRRAEELERQTIFHRFATQYQIDQKLVWVNVPPARVFYWQKPILTE